MQKSLSNALLNTLLLGVSLTTLSSVSAHAAGFFLQEQSVSGQGSAYAGEAAVARDASTIFYNPAGLTELSGAQIMAGTSIIMPTAKLSNKGSTATVGATTTALTGAYTANPYKASPVGNFYAAMPLSNKNLWIGYGLSTPFGLSNYYGPTAFSRYDSTKTRLATFNHSLVAAYKASDKISIGGGIDVQQAAAKLDRSVLITSAGPVLLDAQTSLKGDDVSIGWNAGVLFKPVEHLNIGFDYRSAITHNLKGSVRTGSFLGYTETAGTAELALPDMASLGVAYDVNPQWKVLGGATWYGWSNFNEIRVKRASTADDVTTQGYKNTVALNAGGEYKYSPDWTLRAGVQYDPTPTVDQYRSTRTPDGNRTWLSVGATHKLNDRLSLDLAATQIFVKSEDINVTHAGALPARSNTTIAGAHEDVSIFGIGLKYDF